MLAAGAKSAYLLQASDEALPEGFKAFRNKTDEKTIVVCESQRITTIIRPGLSFFIQSGDPLTGVTVQKHLPDPGSIIVTGENGKFDFDLRKLTISNLQWILKK